MGAMDTSQPLTIESFSYSWLINQKPPLDHLFDDHNDYDEEGNTYPVVNSPTFLEESQNFCFNLPNNSNLVDADEIFFDGRIIPKSLHQLTLYSCPTTPLVHFPPKSPSKYTRKCSQLIENLRASSKRVLGKCFSFLVWRKSSRIVDSSRNSVCLSSSMITNNKMNTRIEIYKTTTFRRTKSWSHNSTSATRFSCSKNNSCDYSEGSVDEAIVHCKRSFEK